MTTALREPQQERSRATRARLLESAVQLLSELGWSGTTVALVAEHVGVSRGATQHYFPTRETLLTAAIDHMADVRMAELRREAERLPAGEQRIEAVLDILVRIYTGPLFRAALQVWAAAATDETLRDQVVELEARLARAAHDLAVRLLGLDESRPGVRQTVQATLDLARGLGLADVLTDDSRRRRAVVRQWAAMLRVTGVARTGKNGNETLTREQGAVTVSESEALSNLLQENRRFEPPAELAANANVKADAYEAAGADFEGFWAGQAKRISWATEPTQTLDWSNPPFAKWFADGKLNAAYNCVDRHVENGLGDRVAYYFEGEPGDTREITYAELKDEVCKAANTLLEFGVKAGDRVAIYMPMIPETVFAMLACARIGAPHTVVFGGFSSEALKDRILDCDARVVITADGGYRRGAAAALKPAVDAAVAECPDVRRVIVVRRTGQEDTPMTEGRDVWWHEYVEKQSAEHTPEAFDAEHPLYVMYTSGTTGKPKGILHTTGGYLVGTSYTHWAVFDLKDDDIFWTAADIGWVTGHSYIVYGALANGASSILYEGTPDTPHKGRWWEIVQKYKVSILYCAPTAIRTFMKWGDDIPAQFDLATLRVIGTVGEPINPEAYVWYRENIGGSKAPVVDTWWQTETGMQMISPLPGVTAGKPGAAMKPLPGVFADVVDDDGKPVPNGSGGYLVLTRPWPAMLRTLWGDDQRYVDTYWSRWPGVYFAGDGAKKDDDGDLWLLGRVDDVMNVAGHRMSTTEIESALVSHPKVAEAAVVGASDPTTGQAIAAFVILRSEAGDGGPDVVKELRDHVAKEIGPIAKPRTIMVVAELPKTRSGKIMRRLLRDVAEKREVGDVTTLADSSVMDLIKHDLEEGKGSDED